MAQVRLVWLLIYSIRLYHPQHKKQPGKQATIRLSRIQALMKFDLSKCHCHFSNPTFPVQDLLIVAHCRQEWQALSAAASIHVLPTTTGAGQGTTDWLMCQQLPQINLKCVTKSCMYQLISETKSWLYHFQYFLPQHLLHKKCIILLVWMPCICFIVCIRIHEEYPH